MASDLVGQVIDGRYRIVSELGAGGVGAVYRAEQLAGGPLVALKMLHDEYGTDAESRERFQREARALNGLQHPHIVGVVDFGMTPEGPYLVMELLDGMPFDAFLEKHEPEPGLALELARQVVAGLAYAHAQGVLHRDMKTENVFIARFADGTFHAKILDFGLAKFVDDERWGPAQKLTMTGAVFGTPAYMSPEQGTGQRVDMRSDVYSTGVVVFEALTGLWPFMGEERMDMLRMHLTTPVPQLTASKEGLEVRPELQALIERSMAKLPEQRFANAGEMLVAMDSVPRPGAWRRGAPAARPGQPYAQQPYAQQPYAQQPQSMSYAQAQSSGSGGSSGLPWLVIGVGVAVVVGIVAVVALAGLFFAF